MLYYDIGVSQKEHRAKKENTPDKTLCLYISMLHIKIINR